MFSYYLTDIARAAMSTWPASEDIPGSLDVTRVLHSMRARKPVFILNTLKTVHQNIYTTKKIKHLKC